MRSPRAVTRTSRLPAGSRASRAWLRKFRSPLLQRGNDGRELDVWGGSAVRVELRRIQEHHAALATGKKLSLVASSALSLYRDSVKAFIATYPAAPSADRDWKRRSHDRIVVTARRYCPYRAGTGGLLDKAPEHGRPRVSHSERAAAGARL